MLENHDYQTKNFKWMKKIKFSQGETKANIIGGNTTATIDFRDTNLAQAKEELKNLILTYAWHLKFAHLEILCDRTQDQLVLGQLAHNLLKSREETINT